VRRTLIGAITAVALAAPAGASGAQIMAGPAPSTYSNPNLEIAQGEAVTFLNADPTAAHDVTSLDPAPGGVPLFSSETVGFLAEVPVEGADQLDPGSYDFICSIHSFMTGTLTVRGGGGGAGAGAGPSLSLRSLDRKLSAVKRAGALRIRVEVDAPAAVRLRATTGAKKVAAGMADLPAGTDVVKAKLTSKGRRLVGKADRLGLQLKGTATADGQSTTRTTRLTLR
jgi:plastocyanin